MLCVCVACMLCVLRVFSVGFFISVLHVLRPCVRAKYVCVCTCTGVVCVRVRVWCVYVYGCGVCGVVWWACMCCVVWCAVLCCAVLCCAVLCMRVCMWCRTVILHNS